MLDGLWVNGRFGVIAVIVGRDVAIRGLTSDHATLWCTVAIAVSIDKPHTFVGGIFIDIAIAVIVLAIAGLGCSGVGAGGDVITVVAIFYVVWRRGAT